MPKVKELEYYLAITDFWISQANHPYLRWLETIRVWLHHKN